MIQSITYCYQQSLPPITIASPYRFGPACLGSSTLVSALAMDESLPEFCAKPATTPLLHQQHTSRRRTDKPPAATPTRSPDRKLQQNARSDGVKSSIQRLRTKEPGVVSNGMGIATHSNRGQQFTVGNISNGLIYLRYHSTVYVAYFSFVYVYRLREKVQPPVNGLELTGVAFL